MLEAFRRFDSPADYQLAPAVVRPEREADGLSVALATDPSGKDLDASKTKYTFELRTKQRSYNGKTYTYFDSAKVQRR